jgi:predicted TIM-barrel fold metal-dependent hydrolase
MIGEFGWHVQFYPGPDDLIEKSSALLQLPTPVVLDHFACIPSENGTTQPAFSALLKMLDTGRVWVKLSGPMRCTAGDFPYAAVTPIARALVAHAPERLLWGSDWPHVNMNGRQMPNDGDLVDLIGEWIDDEATLRRILVDNPRQVYGRFGKDIA